MAQNEIVRHLLDHSNSFYSFYVSQVLQFNTNHMYFPNSHKMTVRLIKRMNEYEKQQK